MVDVTPVPNDGEEQLSLDAWPHDGPGYALAIGLSFVRGPFA